MAILETEVLVKCGLRTDKHYESKGYVISKIKKKDGRLSSRGIKILVKLVDLPESSNIRVTKICDEVNCGRHIPNQSYAQILILRTNNKDYCDECGRIRGGITRKNSIPYESSLEYFALYNNKGYLLNEFSDKNEKTPKNISFGTHDKFLWNCPVCSSEYSMKANERTSSAFNCPFCSGQRVNHTNCLWTTHPHISKLLGNPQDGYVYSKGSGKKLNFTCNICGNSDKKIISNVVRQGFSCSKCGDNLSYPEKFMISVLGNYNIEFETQKIFEWSANINKISGQKRYDFYIPSLNCIIETHGRQHYEEGCSFKGGKSLFDEQENDKLKEQLAMENGIEHYIIIDCRFSELEFIKNSILNNELFEIFNLNIIDWNKCHEFACSTLVKVVCDLWMKDNIQSAPSIGEIVKISRDSVVKYLKQGKLLGWCDYDPKEVRRKNASIQGKKLAKEIVQLNMEREFIKAWNSAKEAGRELRISQGNITSACLGNYKYAGGFKWMHKKDYEEYISLVV